MWEKFSINFFKGVFLHYTIWAFLKLRDKKVKYENMYVYGTWVFTDQLYLEAKV